MSEKTWVLYGATGEAGAFILAEALRRGHRPMLAGRSDQKLRALAEPHGLPWAAASLDDPAGLRAALQPASLVLNVASPFAASGPALMDAALAVGVPYLDIANERAAFQAAGARQAAAQARGVALLPGAGYGVVVADSLARYLAERLPAATELEIALMPYNRAEGAGANRTALGVLAGGGGVWRQGRFVAQALGSGARQLRAPDGVHNILPVPTGDLAAAAQTTGIANITTSWAFPLPPVVARLALPVLSRLVAIPALRQWLERPRAQPPTPPAQPASQLPEPRSYAWARASGPGGQTAEAWLETGEGYAFTAAAAVRSVEQLLARRLAGALTPARAFGTDFVLSIPGARRYDGALAGVVAALRQDPPQPERR